MRSSKGEGEEGRVLEKTNNRTAKVLAKPQWLITKGEQLNFVRVHVTHVRSLIFKRAGSFNCSDH
jgi:hypothetical protein